LAGQIERILEELRRKTEAECVLLADVSGQLISAQGRMEEIDPVTVAALAAGDVAAMSELARQIGEPNPHGSFLHEGEHKGIYLFSVGGSFILIAIFRADTPIGLMRLFVRRAAERLHPLTAEFEDMMGQPAPVPSADFGAILASELDQAFAGL
jgi:predicted regulator of Ras-like GTPase activity (Roadblock/LC7/MglB family)